MLKIVKTTVAPTPTKTVGINRAVWEKVVLQAKRLNSTSGKVVNRILADAFSKAPFPITDGTVLP